MKKIQYIIILLSLFISLTSCEIEPAQDGKATQAGKIVYDETRNTITSYIGKLNLAQKVDFYLQSDSVKRDSIDLWILDDYTIREAGTSVTVKGPGIDWKIARKSNDSLDTPSSQWSIHQSYFEKTTILQITAQARKSWNILTKNSPIHYPSYSTSSRNTAHLQIQMLTSFDFTENAIVNSYSVKMADATPGTITSNTEPSSNVLTCTYTITEPLRFDQVKESNYFVEGEITMEVTRGEDDSDQAEPDKITAKVLPDNIVSITFNGITQKW